MYHLCDAASIVVSVACISCCSSLDLFDFIDVFGAGGIWVPDRAAVFKFGSYKRLVCFIVYRF